MQQLILIFFYFGQFLTSSAREDVVPTMNTFVKQLLAVLDPTQMKVFSTL